VLILFATVLQEVLKFAMYLMVPIGASVIYANHEVMKELSKVCMLYA
jgi:hypothetical protein